jgi:hypothetical protein
MGYHRPMNEDEREQIEPMPVKERVDEEPADEEPTDEEPTEPPAEPQLPSDDMLDETSADSFPASDPPSWSESTTTRNPGER